MIPGNNYSNIHFKDVYIYVLNELYRNDDEVCVTVAWINKNNNKLLDPNDQIKIKTNNLQDWKEIR